MFYFNFDPLYQYFLSKLFIIFIFYQCQNGFHDSADANSTSNVEHTNIHSPDKKNGTRVELGCSPVPLTLIFLH